MTNPADQRSYRTEKLGAVLRRVLADVSAKRNSGAGKDRCPGDDGWNRTLDCSAAPSGEVITDATQAGGGQAQASRLISRAAALAADRPPESFTAARAKQREGTRRLSPSVGGSNGQRPPAPSLGEKIDAAALGSDERTAPTAGGYAAGGDALRDGLLSGSVGAPGAMGMGNWDGPATDQQLAQRDRRVAKGLLSPVNDRASGIGATTRTLELQPDDVRIVPDPIAARCRCTDTDAKPRGIGGRVVTLAARRETSPAARVRSPFGEQGDMG